MHPPGTATLSRELLYCPETLASVSAVGLVLQRLEKLLTSLVYGFNHVVTVSPYRTTGKGHRQVQYITSAGDRQARFQPLLQVLVVLLVGR
jgi:hypothetical protein